MTDKDIIKAAGILKINDILPEMNKNENVIESCEMINNHPSIIIFGKNTGVRYGYVGYDKKDNKIAEKCEDMTFDKETPIFCIIGKEDVLDNIFCKTMGNEELLKMNWIAYDCGHSGETFDEKSVREYYPQDAESIIERNEWRNSVCGDYSPAVRSLNWCRDANKTIIDAFESERTKEKKQPRGKSMRFANDHRRPYRSCQDGQAENKARNTDAGLCN